MFSGEASGSELGVGVDSSSVGMSAEEGIGPAGGTGLQVLVVRKSILLETQSIQGLWRASQFNPKTTGHCESSGVTIKVVGVTVPHGNLAGNSIARLIIAGDEPSRSLRRSGVIS
jgi:hypothetical protein